MLIQFSKFLSLFLPISLKNIPLPHLLPANLYYPSFLPSKSAKKKLSSNPIYSSPVTSNKITSSLTASLPVRIFLHTCPFPIASPNHWHDSLAANHKATRGSLRALHLVRKTCRKVRKMSPQNGVYTYIKNLFYCHVYDEYFFHDIFLVLYLKFYKRLAEEYNQISISLSSLNYGNQHSTYKILK